MEETEAVDSTFAKSTRTIIRVSMRVCVLGVKEEELLTLQSQIVRSGCGLNSKIVAGGNGARRTPMR